MLEFNCLSDLGLNSTKIGEKLEFEDEEIYLWIFRISFSEHCISTSHLTLGEQKRANAFVCPKARLRFIVTRIIRRISNLNALSKQLMSKEERKWWLHLTPFDQREAFYRIWTCKEALLKGYGVGFSIDPWSINLPIQYISETPVESEVYGPWRLETFHIAPYLLGVYAFPGKEKRVINFFVENIVDKFRIDA